jgi:arsenate reductase
MYTIYHNPRCSKSRACLQLLQKAAVPLKIVDYMHQSLSTKVLHQFTAKLGLTAMVRSNEAMYKMLCLAEADEETIIQAIIDHPQLLQRPIVVFGEQVLIARSPEKILELLND